MNLERRYQIIIIAMWATIAANVIIAVGVSLEIASSEWRSTGAYEYWLTRVGDVFQLVSAVTVAILYLRWQYRAVKIRRDIGSFPYTPGWSVAYWFVPFLSLVRPYQVVRRIAESVPAAKMDHMQIWWGLFLISSMSGNIAARFPQPFFDLVSAISWIVAGVLFIPIFKSIAHADQPESMIEHIFS